MRSYPDVARSGLVDVRRPRPLVGQWSAADIARRRARARAADELEAAELRGDDASVIRSWRVVLAALAAAERRRADRARHAGARETER